MNFTDLETPVTDPCLDCASLQKEVEILKTVFDIPMLHHYFPLRPNLNIGIRIPRDMTSAEAMRIIRFIEALVIPEDKS